jgi:ubiquinone/menaquinone biosynthesis C-methylase UbiE
MDNLLEDKETRQQLIEYYEAYEFLLNKVRSMGEYRTHFGMMEKCINNYCWFKSIALPDVYPEMTKAAQAAMDKLHEKIFSDTIDPSMPSKILDVGFGVGGTIKKLIKSYSESEIHGINLHPSQYEFTQQKLNDKKIKLVHADFLTYNFKVKYDLIYFIESAFHILDKEKLSLQSAKIMEKNGKIYITDIFYSDYAMKKIKKNKNNSELIFEYMDVKSWVKLFKKHNIELIDYIDISEQVSNHITINTSIKDYYNDMVKPSLRGMENKETLAEQLMGAYKGYLRLNRLFKNGLLQYGILKFQKK